MVRHLPTVLTQAEAGELLASPNPGDDPMFLRDKTILVLLYGSRMRALEVVGLRVGSLGSHTDSVKITGKGEQDRVVPISKSTAIAATEYQRFLRPSLVHQGQPVPNLFLSHNGWALCERNIWRTVRRYSKRIGLQIPVHPHTLRHSCASHLVQNGADLESVRRILGTKTSRQPQSTYTQMRPSSSPPIEDVTRWKRTGYRPQADRRHEVLRLPA